MSDRRSQRGRGGCLRGAVAPLSLLVAVSGCPSSTTVPGARRHTTEPSRSDLDGIELRSTHVELPDAPAAEYGAAVAHALNPTEQAVVDAMVGLPVTHLPALSRVTRHFAQHVPDKSSMPPGLIDGLMAWSGLPDPQPRMVTVDLPEDPLGCDRDFVPGCETAVAALVEQTGQTVGESGEPVLVGVGVVALPSGTTRMMVAVLDRGVTLEPVPLVVGGTEPIALVGTLHGARSQPRIDVIGPQGNWSGLEVGLSVDGRFRSQFACGSEAGPYQIEVLCQGEHGMEVVANFPVYCGGTEPPREFDFEVEQIDDEVTTEQVARANFLYLNAERKQRGLPVLEWSPGAAAIAHGHSRDMRDHGFFGHQSPNTGGPADRFDRAGVFSVTTRENVAVGYGPAGMHESLMHSPGHRVNILASDVTHVGVGVVVDESVKGDARTFYLTQNFFRPQGEGAPTGELTPALRAKIDELRASAGLAPLPWDDGLMDIAQRRANAIGKGRTPPAGYPDNVYELGFTAVTAQKMSSADYQALAGAKMWTDPTLGVAVQGEFSVGLGVVRTRKEEDFLVVVVIAER